MDVTRKNFLWREEFIKNSFILLRFVLLNSLDNFLIKQLKFKI